MANLITGPEVRPLVGAHRRCSSRARLASVDESPEHVKKWFTLAPWTTVDCEIDLRPGGIFRTVMRTPDGQTFPNIGCHLEIVENERLIGTNAVAPGYRPNESPAARPGEQCQHGLKRRRTPSTKSRTTRPAITKLTT
jgi:uncharacterized protein YndB with AHSA1/START domain